jgi:peptide/nickel transport system permease protein
MARFLVKRAIQGLLTLIVATILIFALMRLIPSDPALVLLREDATPAQIAYVRQLWGLDQPIYVQFWVYLTNLARGDAGDSFQYRFTAGGAGTPAFALVLDRLPATVHLAFAALLISVAVSIPVGVLLALRQDSLLDHSVMTALLVLGSLPVFWIGLELILLFGLVLGVLPTGGAGTPRHVILPALTLALPFAVILTRLTRTEMVRVLREDYIVTARSKGLPRMMVVMKHALRNALVPIVTVTGLRLAALLHGAVVVETVFAWPGLGRLMIESVAARDYPVVQVIVPFAALVFVVINLLVDLSYGWLDPRVRVS